jgi:hypothetical protein
LSQKKLNEKCLVSEWSIDFSVNAFRNIGESLAYGRELPSYKIYRLGLFE